MMGHGRIADRRADIQGLRGMAVLMVMAGHAFPDRVTAGYAGVDLFFVISGWLITGMVVSDMEAGSFSPARFWAGRIKRLLPAAYITIATTTLLAWILLAGPPLADFSTDVAGALSFTLNFSLAARHNYFASSAEFVPLLHMWSLSVEEQFYLVYPLLMLLASRRQKWLVPLLLAATSIFLWLTAWRWFSVSESFFWPFTRAWELALGGLGWMLSRRIAAAAHGLGAASLLLCATLVALALLPEYAVAPLSAHHPSWQAATAALCGLAILWLRADHLWRTTWLMPLRWTGDISYSLYLVHWPVLAFWRAAHFDTDIPAWTAAGLVCLAFLLAALLHYVIERPFHRASLARPWIAFSAALALALPLLMAGWAVSRDARAAMPDSRSFLPTACGKADEFAQTPECRHGSSPRVLLLGDSLAAHLVPGLIASSPEIAFLQATRPACPPLFGIKLRFASHDTPRTAKQCLDWLETLRTSPALPPGGSLVILGGGWLAGWRAQHSGDALYLIAGKGNIQSLPYDADRVVAAMTETVAHLRARGLRVVIAAAPPFPAMDMGMCAAAQAMGKLWTHSDCHIDLTSHPEERAHLEHLLNRFEHEAKVPVFRFEPFLCERENCRATWRGKPLYHDTGHFSPDGFVPLARDIDLFNKLEGMAR